MTKPDFGLEANIFAVRRFTLNLKTLAFSRKTPPDYFQRDEIPRGTVRIRIDIMRFTHSAEQATAGIRILRSSRVYILGNCHIIYAVKQESP
jgi:hypothetical protein